jgi:hypothetical protein
MKERPIFESKEPNKNLVELNDEGKKVVVKALKDLIQSAGFLLDMVSKDTLTEEMRETLTSLIATYSRDGLRPLGFQDQATKDHDDLVRRLRNANMDNEELRQQLGQKVSLEDLREKMKTIARAFDEWGDNHGFGYISDIYFDSYGCLHGNMNLSTHISGNRAEDLRKMGFELTDSRDGEAMFATDENFKLLQKMIRDNFGPDASMSYGKIDMHTFSDERPHMREVEVRLRDLDVMQPWIDEYLERRKQSFDKERNKNKQED